MARKRKFACGHRGKGRFCHQCEAEKREAERKAQADGEGDDEGEEDSKEAWRETFANDPISLEHLPTRGLVRRARMILEEIDRGAPWHQFNGKRLQHDRNVVSIPVGRRYRILFRTDDGPPKPVEVLSHEAYNGTKPGRR